MTKTTIAAGELVKLQDGSIAEIMSIEGERLELITVGETTRHHAHISAVRTIEIEDVDPDDAAG